MRAEVEESGLTMCGVEGHCLVNQWTQRTESAGVRDLLQSPQLSKVAGPVWVCRDVREPQALLGAGSPAFLAVVPWSS